MDFFRRLLGAKSPAETALPADYVEARNKALVALEHSDGAGAFSAVRTFLEFPGRVQTIRQMRDILELFARTSVVLGVPELAGLATKLSKDPEDAQASYDLAFEMYEHRLFGWAATLLQRALTYEPSRTDVLSELAVCLEALGRNRDAVEVLLRAEGHFNDNPVLRYLLAFNLLMTGDVAGSKHHAALIEPLADQTLTTLASSLGTIHARCDALLERHHLETRDLRGWHLALNGSLLLHLSPVWGRGGHEWPLRIHDRLARAVPRRYREGRAPVACGGQAA